MKTVKGDLLKLALEGKFDVIVHGCNCFHTMGAGIAAAIAKDFPEAYYIDKDTAYGVRAKLGTVSAAYVKRGDVEFYVVNAYTQHQGGANADYMAIKNAFLEVKRLFPGKRIAYPKIGAGIGGGDWQVISNIIEFVLAGEDHTFVEFGPY